MATNQFGTHVSSKLHNTNFQASSIPSLPDNHFLGGFQSKQAVSSLLSLAQTQLPNMETSYSSSMCNIDTLIIMMQ